MAWESGLVGGWSNPSDPNVGDWTLGYVTASAVPDPLVGAAVADAYFNFFPLVAPVTLQVIINRNEINETESGGYIRVPARLRRL